MPLGRAPVPDSAQRRTEAQTATAIYTYGVEAHIKIKTIALAIQTHPPDIS